MLDYHLHLWPHSEHETPLRVEQLADYCERAQAAGVQELAVTEHLFRFRQAEALLGGFWNDERVPPALAESMAEYWRFHATADLDEYVACALEAKAAGLPVVIGLEVDYYAGPHGRRRRPPGRVPLRRAAGLGALGRGLALRRRLAIPSPWPSGPPARSTPAGRPTPRRSRSWRRRGRATCWPILT